MPLRHPLRALATILIAALLTVWMTMLPVPGSI